MNYSVCHFYLQIDPRQGFAAGFGVEYIEERTSSDLGIFPNQIMISMSCWGGT